jgi:hypothetical protein
VQVHAVALTTQCAEVRTFLRRQSTSRPRRMLLILVALWLTNVFDAGLTLIAHAQGVLHEVNPLGVWLLSQGPHAVVAFKMSMLLIATGLLWRLRRHPLAELAAWVELATCVLVCLHWRAYYEVYISVSNLALFADGSTGLL